MLAQMICDGLPLLVLVALGEGAFEAIDDVRSRAVMDLHGWLDLVRCMTFSSHFAAPILGSADPPERRLGGTQRDRVAGRSDAMLVVGSSLIVYSSFRFVEIWRTPRHPDSGR
jgi:hypothetical protein